MYKRSDKASDHSGLDFVFFVLHLFQTLSYVTTTYIIKKRINSSGHNHFWISVSSYVIGWDQNQNKANLAERCWKQEEADFFFVAAML